MSDTIHTPHTTQDRGRTYLWFIFIAGLLATLGSLYVERFGDPLLNFMGWNLFPSNGGIPACSLCWYIRVFTYAIFVVSGAHLLFRREFAPNSIILLAIIWIIFSVRKILVQNTVIPESELCLVGSRSCAALDINYFGFISLAVLGLVFFALVIWWTKKWVALRSSS